jgi:hypothetical protein
MSSAAPSVSSQKPDCGPPGEVSESLFWRHLFPAYALFRLGLALVRLHLFLDPNGGGRAAKFG